MREYFVVLFVCTLIHEVVLNRKHLLSKLASLGEKVWLQLKLLEYTDRRL